ncbi:MAG: tetratricopeptide repeat protein [Candidatus Poribacteria bacterium]|nr:tetratricopeptide repeat protein [Candidatus Poribacteria bacterium]MDE0315622.1 tetratricopeptide repeat protein [Candidatus Poribacteria bacterium]MDE0483733.1 tetratricopeptide repeat protein [Candidatus Poribacteria bacterium]
MMAKQDQELAKKYFNSGIEKSKKDEYELAIEDYTKAIELKPDYAEAYYYRGGSWLRLGEREKAKEDLDVARDLAMDAIIALDKIGQDYERAWKILGNM